MHGNLDTSPNADNPGKVERNPRGGSLLVSVCKVCRFSLWVVLGKNVCFRGINTYVSLDHLHLLFDMAWGLWPWSSIYIFQCLWAETCLGNPQDIFLINFLNIIIYDHINQKELASQKPMSIRLWSDTCKAINFNIWGNLAGFLFGCKAEYLVNN